jgi:hypothetical protein
MAQVKIGGLAQPVWIDGGVVDLAAGTSVNVRMLDENGTPYGVKHIDNKIRVSSVPYYTDIAKGNIPNHTAVNKFGHNSAVGATLEPVWDFSGVYDYLADDTFATMYISSDDGLDQGMTYEVSGIDSDYNASTVTVTTDGSDGNTFVALSSGAADNQWWRIFRALNTSGTAAQGNIYISKDNTDVGGNGIPDDTADIQAQVVIGLEQTLMAQWTCPVDNQAFLTHLYASTSTVKVTEIHLYTRPFGGVFNIKYIITLNASAYAQRYDFPLNISAKSDIRIMASAVGSGGEVSAGFDLWYETS